MASQCLFCDNPAGSKEHLWAKWIHKRKDFGPLRIKVGASAEKISSNPQRTIDTVCGNCNNGWMSALEQRNIPVIGSLLQDVSIPLDEEQQFLLSAWAVKTAMVMDSVKDQKTTPLFYKRIECEEMRLNRIIPDRTRIWIGRYSQMGLGAFGTDLVIVNPELEKIGLGCATTIIVGHLAVQVLAMHAIPDYGNRTFDDIQPKPGDWGNMLVPIWPIGRQSVMWPPSVTFTNSGPRSIAKLMDRWKLGKNVGT